jgi:hypothetical protein
MNHHSTSSTHPADAGRNLAGFDAVMDGIQGLTPQEIANRELQADSAEFGHDAYALGLTFLEHGDSVQAERWLRKAARYHVAGAQQVLEEAGLASAFEPDPTGTSPSLARLGDGGVPKNLISPSVGGIALPATHESLARGVMSSSSEGTVFALGLMGGVTVGPADGRQIYFGRDRNMVHVCIGEDDPKVSRHHGTLTYHDGRWRVRNTGRLPIRLASRLLFPDEDPIALGTGFTQMFVQSSPGRLHLLEVFVTGPDAQQPVARHDEATRPPTVWRLSDDERLVLVVLSQRYLLHEPQPQPLSWRRVADQLGELRPDARWSAKKAEHVVAEVRGRLAQTGVVGLTREQVSEPVGNRLSHNLIQELLMSTTLVPRDLVLLDAA